MNLDHSRRDGFVALRAEVRAREDLEQAQEEVRVLRGILPMCASCKKVRGEHGSWQDVEVYGAQHSAAHF